VWALRPDTGPDDAPARRLAIYGRLEAPPRILALADEDSSGGARTETDIDNGLDEEEEGMLLSVLDRYQLQSLSPFPAADRAGKGALSPAHGGAWFTAHRLCGVFTRTPPVQLPAVTAAVSKLWWLAVYLQRCHALLA
jgi:hypothetical protein